MRAALRLSIASLLALAAISANWNSLLACTQGPPPATPPTINITWTDRTGSPWKGKITIHGYKTFGADSTNFCACGLNFLNDGTFTSVDSVVLARYGTQLHYPGFPTFLPNNNVGSGFGGIYSAGGYVWKGFLTHVNAFVPVGDSVDVCIFFCSPVGTPSNAVRVALPPDRVGPAAVQASAGLSNALRNGRIGTSEGTSAGNLVAGHTLVLQPAAVCAPLPISSAALIALLAALLASIGVWVLKRRAVGDGAR